MIDQSEPGSAVAWWRAEPARRARDEEEISCRFRGLAWHAQGAGVWAGRLPVWPLERPEPPGLSTLLGGHGLEVEVAYRQAYPMVPPRIFPLDPRPEPLECTQHRWHVNGDGSLCLFQTETAWDPRDSLCDLLVKAAAWRIEYALMKQGVLEQMTVHGIVSDASLDELITVSSQRLSAGGSREVSMSPTANDMVFGAGVTGQR